MAEAPEDTDVTPCGDPLHLPARAEVNKVCVLPAGHKGFCKSDDGRSWQTGTGNHR